MKNFWLTVGLIVAVCAVSHTVFYSLGRDPDSVRRALVDQDAMAWLRADFKLSDTQFAAIERLHDDYYVQCSEHCAMIMDARENQAPEIEVARLEEVCERAMAQHFRKVAAEMSAKEGARYLAIVLPKIASYDHQAPPNLQVSP